MSNPRNTDLRHIREDLDSWFATGSGAGFAVFSGELITAATIGGGAATSSGTATSTGMTMALAKDTGASIGDASQFQAVWIG